jgi:hypothetical protein
MTSIRDHSFHLDSPGQSMSWKENVFLMFCTLSVLTSNKLLIYASNNWLHLLSLFYFVFFLLVMNVAARTFSSHLDTKQKHNMKTVFQLPPKIVYWVDLETG